MQKRPITIALAIAGLIAGTTAGIAAINSDIAPVAAQPAAEVKTATEPQLVTEVQAPAAVVAQAEPAAAAPVVTVAPTKAPTPPAARSTHDETMVRVPFTNYYVRVTNPTFPSSGAESPEMLPATVAYFDRIESTRLAANQPAPAAAPVAALDLPSTIGTALQSASPANQVASSGN